MTCVYIYSSRNTKEHWNRVCLLNKITFLPHVMLLVREPVGGFLLILFHDDAVTLFRSVN